MGSPWTSRQVIAGLIYRDKQPSTLTVTPTGNLEWPINLLTPSLHVFGTWEEARVPGVNPRRHMEKTQTPQRNALTIVFFYVYIYKTGKPTVPSEKHDLNCDLSLRGAFCRGPFECVVASYFSNRRTRPSASPTAYLSLMLSGSICWFPCSSLQNTSIGQGG